MLQFNWPLHSLCVTFNGVYSPINVCTVTYLEFVPSAIEISVYQLSFQPNFTKDIFTGYNVSVFQVFPTICKNCHQRLKKEIKMVTMNVLRGITGSYFVT